LISLVDCREEDGGFHTVPQFSKYHFEEWAKSNANSDHAKKFEGRNFVTVPKEDNLFWDNVQKIPMRAGSLLVWNSKQPHGNYPNNSDRFRICQYIKMISVDHVNDENLQRDIRGMPEYLIPKNFEVSELGQKLFGLKKWDQRNYVAWIAVTGVVLAVLISFAHYYQR